MDKVEIQGLGVFSVIFPGKSDIYKLNRWQHRITGHEQEMKANRTGRVCPAVWFENQWMNSDETWYGYCITGGDPKLKHFNVLQPAIPT
jgi:hypothetical protein